MIKILSKTIIRTLVPIANRLEGIKIAKIGEEHEDWIKSKARRINIEDDGDKNLALKLDYCLQGNMMLHGWICASSNNLYWPRSETPLRVIIVPVPDFGKYITIINPEIESLSGEKFVSIEGCASLPGEYYGIRRYLGMVISGKVIENCRFKDKTFVYERMGWDGKPVILSDRLNPFMRVAIVQHEIDHLNGLLISRGIRYGQGLNKNRSR